MRSKPPESNEHGLKGNLSTGCPQGQIELADNAWDRFERAVDQVIKSPPQHRVAPKVARKATKKKATARKKA